MVAIFKNINWIIQIPSFDLLTNLIQREAPVYSDM